MAESVLDLYALCHQQFGPRDTLNEDEYATWRDIGYPGLEVVGDGPRNSQVFAFNDTEFQLSNAGSRLLIAVAQRAGFAATYGTINQEAWKNGAFRGGPDVQNINRTSSKVNAALSDEDVGLRLDSEDYYGIRLLEHDRDVSPLITEMPDHPKVVKANDEMPDGLLVDGFRIIAPDGQLAKLTMLEYLVTRALLADGIDGETGEGADVDTQLLYERIAGAGLGDFARTYSNIGQTSLNANAELELIGYRITAHTGGRGWRVDTEN